MGGVKLGYHKREHYKTKERYRMTSQKGDKKNPGLAIAGLVVSIIGLLLSALPIINNFAFVLGLLGLILAVIAWVKARKNDELKTGMAIAAATLSILTITTVLITQQIYLNAINEAGKSIEEASQKLDNNMKKITGDATEELLKNDVEVTLGQFQVVADEYGFNTTSLPVTVKNKNKEAKNYSVQIEVVDASGNRLTDDTIYASSLGSGQAQEFKAFQFVGNDILENVKTGTFKIKTVTQS